MSKNVGLIRRQMEKKLHMRLLVERQANPQVTHQKGNGHARILRLDLDRAIPEKKVALVKTIFWSRGKESRRVIAFAGIDAGENRYQLSDGNLVGGPIQRRRIDKRVNGLVPVLEASCTQRAVARRVVANLRAFYVRVVGAVASPR